MKWFNFNIFLPADVLAAWETPFLRSGVILNDIFSIEITFYNSPFEGIQLFFKEDLMISIDFSSNWFI